MFNESIYCFIVADTAFLLSTAVIYYFNRDILCAVDVVGFSR